MAVNGVQCFGSSQRERGSRKRKLLVNERVEVRSVEEGFLGSWHPGTVIQCGKQKRHVRYDNILVDEGTYYLVDVVSVSAALDGAIGVSSPNRNKRGLIRPLPPSTEFGGWDLPFGLCVDVSYQEAWWEGVIFDHCDGMEERSIFFPDLGDEMKIGIQQLRITQDWDEVTEKWERRGNWVFLELVEECERSSFVAVSVKQIWYDVRVKKDFDMIRDWTFNVKDMWRDLVMEVVSDYFTLTVKEVFPVLNLPRGFLKERPERESVEPTANADFNQEVDMANFVAVVKSGSQLSSNTNVHCDASPNNAFGSDIGTAHTSMEICDSSNLLETVQNCGSIISIQEKCDMDPLVDGTSNIDIMADLNMTLLEKKILVWKEPVSPVQEVLPESRKEISCYDAGEVVSGASYEKNREDRCSTRSRSARWQPLILSEVEFCPGAVNQYALASNSKMITELKTKVRKHLAYLGWEIEWSKHKVSYPGQCRYRYKSPDKQSQKVYFSLRQVCKLMQKESNMNSLLSQNNQSIMHPTVDSNLSHLLLDQLEKSQDQDVFPSIVPPPPVKVVPEFCPQAIVEYYSHALEKHWADKKKWTLKAKKHLLAEGWIFDYSTEKRRRMLYKSPQNLRFGSLRGACRLYIKESIPKWTISGMKPLNVSVINKENVDQVDNGDLLHSVSQLLQKEPELQTIDGVPAGKSTGNRKRKRMRNLKASLPKCQRNGLPLRVLQSSKRVQKVFAPRLSHHKPQNVLSWLIDSNMVLPRSKVYYRSKSRQSPMAEGRITSDGIKCNCCQKVYSLGGFENHASGSSNRRPAASIFLEDGRSLLDCQKQIMHDRRTRETMEKPCNNLYQDENDYICSVCQYGGDLILCDQCPSSFHKMCLGLEDIPDGDWFCPSCRCGICGQSKIDGAEGGHFLTCIQCEHKYHVRCLRNRAVNKSRRYQENWLCGKDCEKIYAGLHKVLGEPVSVGVNNLTWTLVKSVNSESCGLGSTDNDLLADSYSKLNVALSVMHECFEPLKEPSSSRDLMEDVIFSRWSELNRLNFQGFYTVLLEKNEELISVATVRVHGEKVAEVPLVGTRFQYRRHGMCRILMDELEKKLMQLGVERLVLPAVPSVLETWTGSLGFAKMANFERLQFPDYTFLDFQGTVMCQKLLTKIPSPDSVLSRESQQKPHDVFSVRCSINFDKSSPVSEVYQAEEVDKSGMLNLQMVDNFAGKNDHLDSGAIDLVTMVEEPIPEGQRCHNGTSPQCSLVKQVGRYNNSCKYYKRRKVSKA